MNERINLQDLSALLSEKTAITKKDAETFLREYFDLLNEELLNSGTIKIKDLGTFKLLQVEDRESVDVTTGERVLIPAHYKVVFTPDKKLAETVNEPFSFFETIEIEDDVSDELQLLPEEDASEESELSADEEEEVKKEVKKEVKGEVKEEVIPEEKPTYKRDLQNYCLNCYDYEAHHVFRKKYFNIRKKMRTVVLIFSLLLAIAVSYIIYVTIAENNVLVPIFQKITELFDALKYF